MRKIQEVLRLHHENGFSERAIGRACNISKNTVKSYLLRVKAAGFLWPLPDDISEADLDELLFPKTKDPAKRPGPDPQYLHKELSRKGVTLQLLWKEYIEQHPNGYGYSRFCDIYRDFTKKHKLSMRQHHKAGEKVFVDFAGQTMSITNPDTGEITESQIFVAVLGVSNYMYVEAVSSQDLTNWLSCHVRTFNFYKGVPEIVVPDNLKAAVNKPCRYEPDLNPSYQDLAQHYGVAIIPARVRKPQDKAKAETGVQITERQILAPLRNEIFFSLQELNRTLWKRLADVNKRVMKSYGVSRKELFETLDRPALKPLPLKNYEMAFWKKAKVNLDYHVELGRHYYSVPYRFVHKTVKLRYTRSIVEIYYQGMRVASHRRSQRNYSHTTNPDHMPKEHRSMLDWTPSRFLRWAKNIGPCTENMIRTILESRQHPEQGYRSCLGLLRLEKEYGSGRLENACARALHFGLVSRKHVLSILKTNQDHLPLPVKENPEQYLKDHENLRGSDYYH